MLIAGHPQTVYSVAPLVVAVRRRRGVPTSRAWRRLGYVAAAGVVGLMLAAPQLLPEVAATSEAALSGQAARSSVVDSPVYRLDVGHTVRALLGNPLTDFPDADAGTYEAMSFVGAAAATLAVVGFVDGVRRRRRRVFTIVLGAVGLAGLIAAYGPRTWPYRFAYDHVPLVRPGPRAGPLVDGDRAGGRRAGGHGHRRRRRPAHRPQLRSIAVGRRRRAHRACW